MSDHGITRPDSSIRDTTVHDKRETFAFSIPARTVIRRRIFDDGRFGPPIVVAVCTSPAATRAAFRLCIGCPPGVLPETDVESQGQ